MFSLCNQFEPTQGYELVAIYCELGALPMPKDAPQVIAFPQVENSLHCVSVTQDLGVCTCACVPVCVRVNVHVRCLCVITVSLYVKQK
jgi:hypothetical protein